MRDKVNGSFSVDSFTKKIIQLPEFQRLRDIKQLGCCHYVFEKAKHNRFEHSVGVWYLANKTILKIRENHPELMITDSEVKCVSLAGLFHDIGHGPLSHFYDVWLSGKDVPHPHCEHEHRSCTVIEYLVSKYSLDISKEEITMIQNMINPTRIPKSRRFLYQIIANKDTDLDVDKMDYIQRDSIYLSKTLHNKIDFDALINGIRIVDHNIVYNSENYIDVLNIFTLRYLYHRDSYNCSDTKAVDHIMMKIFDKLYESGATELVEAATNIETLMYLTDSYVESLILRTKDCSALYCVILSKGWWKCVDKIKLPPKIDLKVLRTNLDEIVTRFPNTQIAIAKIGLVSGNKKNPLSCVQFYHNDSPTITFKINKFVLFQESFQEVLVYVYRDLKDAVKDKSLLNTLNDTISELLED